MEERIVFLIRNVAEDAFGGGEIYQLELAKRLKDNGFCPIIITNSKKLLHEAKSEDIQFLKPPYLAQQNWSGWRNLLLPKYLLFQNRLKRWYLEMVKKYQPTVINIQSRDDMIAGTLAAKKCGVKILWTDHADFKNWVLWNVNVKLKNMIGKKIIELSDDVDEVIFVSEEVEKATTKMIYPRALNNIKVIKNGVDDKLKDYYNVNEVKDSFIFVGRVVEEKGIRELIDAFKTIKELHPKIELNIYGDGDDFEKFERFTNGDEEIKFYGRTEKPLKAMAENEIFVLPSYSEGLSLSLLDAAMMKKKIIASNVDGNLEVIVDGETGLLVPPKDVNKLAEAMIWMLENKKEAEKMAKNVRKKYEDNFDFDKIFKEEMLPLYNDGGIRKK